ncbi:YchJ family metal-binding protein [Cryobacterium sp. SO2]|uniref:YchJ family protein n=1 Tax=Cryobacterium sp. SO2 TaxID=1897060 RepID=UPI00223E46DB|nr:YchJ family metal-binding protein [Cryobacterium sp. SO2]WEO75767.1 YchJ family metal-binding protein [Cryobacterium sp. SO2]
MPAPDPAATPDRHARCPCLSGNDYGDCCGRLHRAEARAATAQMLMRSRYAAFAVGDADYLLRSWHPRTRPETLELDPSVRWLRLDIERTSRGGPLDTEGIVEFTAYSVRDGIRTQQHEVSRFEKVSGDWLYLDAVG